MAKPANRSDPLTKRQRALLNFLRAREAARSRFTIDELAQATGYKPDSVRTNVSEGHWTAILTRDGAAFRSTVKKMTDSEFHTRISQSKRVHRLLHRVSAPLANALVARSRENMVLALEVYNRPTLGNRLDAFVMLFCVAWEQLLKAELIELHGEERIFKTQKPNQMRQSIGLTECLDAVLDKGSPVKKNVEAIQELRDRAVHLLFPEVQHVASRIFQSGVLNYARRYESVAGQPFLPRGSYGLLSLVGDLETQDALDLAATYGSTTGDDIQGLIAMLAGRTKEADSIEFAIPLEYRLAFVKREDDADVTLSLGGSGAALLFVDRPRAISETHPFATNEVVQHVNTRVAAELSAKQLERHLPSRRTDKISKARSPAFVANDLVNVAKKQGWRNSDNEFHAKNPKPAEHLYSSTAIDYLVERICKDADFLARAKPRRK